ncbi:MAG: hypothetical protein ACC656_10515 [Candidatus Heimdallarchaeota archaeon]
MPMYIRAYEDYSYEIIYTEGKLRKKRIHLLVNPGAKTRIRGPTTGNETEVNIQSLTHIVAMETSIVKPQLMKRTIKIAEMTNKPIITNKESSDKFRENGISVKQLRILGFQEEVIDGLFLDPIYMEELGDTSLAPVEEQSKGLASIGPKLIKFTKSVPRRLNPFKWKPVKKITRTITKTENDEIIVDPSKPLAIYLRFSKSDDIIMPLDVRAMDHLDELLPQITPKLITLPNVDVSDTLQIKHNARALIVFNKQNKQEKAMIIPKAYNPETKHDTIYAAFEEWVDIDEIF